MLRLIPYISVFLSLPSPRLAESFACPFLPGDVLHGELKGEHFRGCEMLCMAIQGESHTARSVKKGEGNRNPSFYVMKAYACFPLSHESLMTSGRSGINSDENRIVSRGLLLRRASVERRATNYLLRVKLVKSSACELVTAARPPPA